MTTLSSAAGAPAGASAPDRTLHKISFTGILRSEWIKFRSVRSTVWLLVFTLVAMVGTSALLAVSLRAFMGMDMSDDANVTVEPAPGMGEGADMGIIAVTSGYQMGQLVLTVLALLVVTSEFSTGRIRSTLVAVPTRTPVLVAKALLVVIVTFIVAAVSTVIQYGVSALILSGTELAPSLAGEHTIRQLLGVPLYLTAICLFAFGIGAIMRSTPGSIAIVMAVLLVLPVIGALVNLEWVQTIAAYLPTTAGEAILYGPGMNAELSPWQGYGVLGVWALGTTVIGALMWRSRDA